MWIRTYHPAPDAPRLVCLAHAGGSATAFFSLAKRLSPRVEVLAVQYPGRQDRRKEPFATDVRAVAAEVHAALEPFADRPLAVFGHSMGASVAFELALRLQRDDDDRLLGFVASGQRAPSAPRRHRVRTTDEEILSDLHELAGTDIDLLRDEGMIDLILPPLRADYAMIDAYRNDPADRLHIPTLVCIGDSDPVASVDEARAWSNHVDGPFDFAVLRGGHFYLNEREDELAELLERQLGAWLAARPG